MLITFLLTALAKSIYGLLISFVQVRKESSAWQNSAKATLCRDYNALHL